MTYLSPPLEKMKLTQPFGRNDHGIDYSQFGMKGHNGIDLSAPIGTMLYACMDGEVRVEKDNGYGNTVRLFGDGLEVVNGHLSEFMVDDEMRVNAGMPIAYTGNTGFSTGPHLHFGTRRRNAMNNVIDYTNGYYGYVDPMQFFEEDPFLLPVDKRYGIRRTWQSYLREKSIAFNPWVARQLGRLPSNREINAMAYGYWDLRTVIDPAMFETWSTMHKPEYMKRLRA